MVKIAYFAHDLADAAIQRRASMLRQGGAEVRLAGFRRRANEAGEPGEAIELGKTQDGRLAARALAVAASAARIEDVAPVVEGADAILARNLEMLALASRARKRFAPHARLVYECLDIHRLLSSKGLPGVALRFLESRLWKSTDAIVTSSPAFVREYFDRRGYRKNIFLIENKVLDTAQIPRARAAARKPGPPWRIGYFGMLRCRRSLDILANTAAALQGKLQVAIRGVPSPAIFQDFHQQFRRVPHVTYYGPYSGAAELAEAYADVHFAWAIDYYEAGLNSEWLLPNRLYESLYFGAIPIALGAAEVGRWLERHGAGVRLPGDGADELLAFLSALTAERYGSLCGEVEAISTESIAFGESGCKDLVERLVPA